LQNTSVCRTAPYLHNSPVSFLYFFVAFSDIFQSHPILPRGRGKIGQSDFSSKKVKCENTFAISHFDKLSNIKFPFLPRFPLCHHQTIGNVHSRKEKVSALDIQIARQAVHSSSEFYDFCSFISFISAFSQI
jgi:hypothetical protein